jgi:hypothetical protein
MAETLPQFGRIEEKPYFWVKGKYKIRLGCGACPVSCEASRPAVPLAAKRADFQICQLTDEGLGLVWCGAPGMDKPNT